MNNKVTRGYLVAIESGPDEIAPDVQALKIMFETLLQDHGYDVTVSVEAMGEIDCYPESE